MISCTDFIPAYNEAFKFLQEKGGRELLEKFWKFISDRYLQNLDRLVAEKGLAGMEEYWGKSLTEEAADCVVERGDDYFLIDMFHCPSVGHLNDLGLEKCSCYCDHCPALYPPIISRYGFEVQYDIIDRENGRCRMYVKKPNPRGSSSQ
ncbi:MAG TPA: hypothetical protein GXX51_08490 [Firmicutes bacterium]|nr:hypothetical protein [Bacillota bacterium]